MASRLSSLSSSNLTTLNFASSKTRCSKIAVQAGFSCYSLLSYNSCRVLREVHDDDNSNRKLKHLNVVKGSHGGAAQKQKAKCPIGPEKLELFKSLEGWAEENILTLLKPVESSWQPQDLLPEPSDEEAFLHGFREIRERAAEIPDEYFVCLVGNMITEEALPTYQSMLNTFDGVRDETGASMTPWARWIRKWTAEENRHGDVLNKYLYITGRLDMRQIEKTIQYLIGSGMVLHSNNNPYRGFIYTSFQERATSVSHGNTARRAKAYGDATLAKMCGLIAADEKRHEKAYAKIVEKLFELDPDTTMLALADMLRLRITMPAALLFDGHDERLFDHYSAVAQRIGVYTTRDYGDILEFFLGSWDVENVAGLSPEGRRAQDYVCALPQRIRRMEELAEERARARKSAVVPFSWIFNRSVRL